MSIVRRLLRSCSNRGIHRTIVLASLDFYDFLYDYLKGYETSRWADIIQLKTHSPNLTNAARYQPTRSLAFFRLLKLAHILPAGTFVDVGSGKGRVLLMAAKAGFRSIRGIEFCSELCYQARQNIQKFLKCRPEVKIEIIHSDITEYLPQADEQVYFLYNPFHQIVLNKFLVHLKNSSLTHPRSMTLIYHEPIYETLIDESRIFSLKQKLRVLGCDFVVFKTENK